MRIFIVFFLLIMVSGHLYGDESYLEQLPPLIDREIFFDDPEITAARLSLNGEYISFIRPYKGVMNIWMKNIDQPFEDARPVTADTTRPIPAYFWSRDSRYILYVQDKAGDENFHVYAVDPVAPLDPETGVPPARNLTDIEDVRAYIFELPRNTPNYIIVGLNDRDPSLHDIYRLNLTTGERILLYQNDHNILGWNIDNDGNLRYATRQTAKGGQEILKPVGDDFVQVYEVDFEEQAGIIRLHPDARRVYLITNKGEDVDLMRLVLFDPETGEKELIEEDPKGEADISAALFSDITDELVYTTYVGDRLRVYYHDERFAKDYERARRHLPDADLYRTSRTTDENLWLITVTSDVDPGATYLYNTETGDIEFLYRPRPNLPTEYLAGMIPIRYTARDGLEIPGYLTIPKGVEPENLPLIVHPHGGPWFRDTWGYRDEVQFLANRGYAVFQPNFRGSTGYGKEFLNAGNKEWGTGYMQHDITDGVKYLIEEGIADPERIGIYGGSYGGFATLAGLAFTPELYKAGVSFVGISNIISWIESFPPYWLPILEMIKRRVGDIDDPEDRQRLIEQSPLFSAHEIQAPLLVVQGANDPRVTQLESDQIVIAMRDLDRHVEYIVAPDEGHGFAGRENRIAFYVAMEKFLATHLGGRYQEEVSAEIAGRLNDITIDIHEVKLPEEVIGFEDAATAPLPEFVLKYIKPIVLTYSSRIAVAGQEMEMASTRTISAMEFNDHPVWSVIDGASGPMGAVADTFYLNYESLIPVHRSAVQGMTTISIDYHDAEIKGQIVAGPQTIPLAVNLEAPVLGDGGALDLALISLPLEVGYETTFRTFDLMSQKVIVRHLKVVGVEEIEIPAGTFEALKLEIVPFKGDTGKRTVWIEPDETRTVLKSIDILPAMMGGESATSVLTSIQ